MRGEPHHEAPRLILRVGYRFSLPALFGESANRPLGGGVNVYTA